MSNFRTKAQEVKAAGEAERGNFEPQGTPKRMYQYWLKESNSKGAKDVRRGDKRENFCHFWRVVAIWAPLMFLRRTGEKVVASPAGAISLIVGALAALTYLGIVSGGFREVLFVIIAAVGLVAVTFVIVAGIYWVASLFTDDPDEALGKIVFGIMILAAAAALTIFLVILAMEIGWALLWGTLILLAIGFLAFLMISPIATYISGKRALRKKEADERREKFIRGELSHEEYFGTQEPREPGKIAKFFSGIGDFIVLAAQVVRVNKWKICPLVDVDPKA